MRREDLELILHPMAEEGKEASGSMGDDTPVAVLSSHFRPVSHYFRQNIWVQFHFLCIFLLTVITHHHQKI